MAKKKSVFIALLVFVLLVATLAACSKKGGNIIRELTTENGVIASGEFNEGDSLVCEFLRTISKDSEEIAILKQHDIASYNTDKDAYVFDIHIKNNGEKVQPKKSVTITMNAPCESETGFVVFHLLGESDIESLETTYADGKILFVTSSFSTFVVAEKAKEVTPKYTFKATVENGGGKIEFGGMAQANGYAAQMKEGATVKLKAVANENYSFVGWYTQEDSPALVSSDAEYTFTMSNADMSVFARFEANVVSLSLDAHNAGFKTEEATTVIIGSENLPKADSVIVKGVKADQTSVTLTKDTDYTVDLGGLDFTEEGTYTITFTYKKDATVKATLAVNVVASKYAFQATVENGGGKIEFGGAAQANGYAAQMKEGATVTLKAVADELYTFVGWYTQEDSPKLISSDAEYTFTMSNADMSVFARFEETYTEAQNYADFINSLNYSLNFDGANGYTVKSIEEYSYSSGDNETYQITETMLGDKYASVYKEISTPYNEETSTSEEISALKPVTVNGKERKKWVSFVTNSDGSKQNEGRLKSALFDLEMVAWYMPTDWFDYLCMDVSGDTFEEYAAAFIQAYNKDNAQYNNQTADVTLKRNADGTLTFGFVARGAYKAPWIQKDGYQQTVFDCKYEIILDGSRITKLTSYNKYDYVYEDEAQNNWEILIENYEYGYSFDSTLYESVPTETDTTVDEVTGTISFYINGYRYSYSMSDIALDSTVTLDDVLNHLSDGGEGLTKPLFNIRFVDKSLFKVYTDKEMTQEFTSLTVTDERYTLYVKMTPPSNKAIVMSVREYGESRGIDLCYLKDLNTTYNPANYYPVIEIDGTPISNNEYYTITCSESRIYVIVSKVR